MNVLVYETFKDLYSDKKNPDYYYLDRIIRTPLKDDFGIEYKLMNCIY